MKTTNNKIKEITNKLSNDNITNEEANKILYDNLLIKRLNFLIKISQKEKKNGYKGLTNLKIENNSILFNNNIEDCRYDEKYFYIVGYEGEEKIELKTNNFLNKIKKIAKELDCGGLK